MLHLLLSLVSNNIIYLNHVCSCMNVHWQPEQVTSPKYVHSMSGNVKKVSLFMKHNMLHEAKQYFSFTYEQICIEFLADSKKL